VPSLTPRVNSRSSFKADTKTTPVYSDIESSEDSGEKRFTAEVRVKGSVLGLGEGRTKKEAESQAARCALDEMANTLHPSDALLHLD